MKKILAIMLVAIMLISTACSSKEASQTDASSESTTNVEEYYPVTITDQYGRTVTIESEPQRIVSTYYITSSLFISLGLDNKMVGIENTPERRPIYSLSAPELLDLTTVGTVKEFDLEACLALEPDLVVLPLRLADTADTLEELGIPVILVNPENADLIIEMTEVVSTATNTQDKGQELIKFIKDTRDLLETNLDGADEYTIYLGGNSDFLSTAGNGMYQSDMISLAGAKNVADEIDDDYWVEVSYEQVLSWNPDYIFLAADAGYTAEDVLNDENLSMLDAVINGNVYQLPSCAEAWDSPVPSSILGSLWLANVIHEDRISDDLCSNTIEDFYETFYGFSYSSIIEN